MARGGPSGKRRSASTWRGGGVRFWDGGVRRRDDVETGRTTRRHSAQKEQVLVRFGDSPASPTDDSLKFRDWLFNFAVREPRSAPGLSTKAKLCSLYLNF